MVKLAVIGRDVSQSASPPIHEFISRELGKQITYERISIPEEQFESAIEKLLTDYDGLNVTIPYKLSVIPKLKQVAGDALSFGAVNTVFTATRTGYNTDGLGFMKLLKSHGIEVGGKSVLVLGAGGAGRSAVKKLLDAGAEVEIYNRTYSKAFQLEKEFKGCKAVHTLEIKPRYLIINATGVGMHESVGQSPVSQELLVECQTAVDLIYHPARSEFLRIAESLGKQTVNGYSMLFYQAYYADCIFLGIQPNEEMAVELFNKYLKESKR